MKSESVTIQMKATEQYFPVVLFIMLCKVVLIFHSVNKIQGGTTQMKAFEHYSLSWLLVMSSFDSVYEIMVWPFNGSYRFYLVLCIDVMACYYYLFDPVHKS